MTPSQDGSGHERLQEYMQLYSDESRYIVGRGLSGFDKLDLGMIGIDGQLVFSAYAMGIFVGNIHILAMIWAFIQGMFHKSRDEAPLWLVARGVVIANVILLPLLAIAGGEVGFCVWAFAALLTAKQEAARRPKPGPATRARPGPIDQDRAAVYPRPWLRPRGDMALDGIGGPRGLV